MNSDTDRDLRARFDALKRHSAANTPPFDVVLNRRHIRPERSKRGLTFAIAATVVLALVVTFWRPTGTMDPPETSVPAWPRTTESLLVAIAAPSVHDWSQLPTEILDRLPKLPEQETR